MTKFNSALWHPELSIKENAVNLGICYNHAAVLARENGLIHKKSKLKFGIKIFATPLANSIENIKRSMDRLKPDQVSWLLWEGSD